MSVKIKTLDALSKLGYSDLFISMYDSISNEITKIEVDDDIKSYTLNNGEQKGYVLLVVIPGYHEYCLYSCIIGHMFRYAGYKPIILRDDGFLPNQSDLSSSQGERDIYSYRSKRYPELFNIETVTVRELINRDGRSDITTEDSTKLQEYTYKGYNISEPAAASARQHTKRYRLDLSEEYIQNLYLQFLESGIILIEATQNIIKQYKPKVAIVNLANYIQGRVPLEVCHNANVNVYTQGTGYHEGELMFGRAKNRNAMGQFGDEQLTRQAIERELSNRQVQTIQAIMEKRKTGGVTRVQYSSDSSTSVEVSEKNLVGIFSHLLWDGALEPQQALYDDIYNWLKDTIDAGSDLEDTHFVIKAHPAERLRGTNESVMDWLDETYTSLPDNVSVLPPDTRVNTYELLQDLDAGIVYASTVGLEMAYNGIPVVVGGFPPYHGFGLTYDPSTKEAYSDKIRNIQHLDCSKEMETRAKRFAYFLFVCKQLDFPYDTETTSDNEPIYIEHNAIVGEHSPYSIIVEQMINDEEILSPDCMYMKA